MPAPITEAKCASVVASFGQIENYLVVSIVHMVQNRAEGSAIEKGDFVNICKASVNVGSVQQLTLNYCMNVLRRQRGLFQDIVDAQREDGGSPWRQPLKLWPTMSPFIYIMRQGIGADRP